MHICRERLTRPASTTAPGDGRERHQLTFPPFHRGLTSQSHWDASDRVGRIRVELAAGYVDERNGHFVKLLNAITFAFQPAPMGKSLQLRS